MEPFVTDSDIRAARRPSLADFGDAEIGEAIDRFGFDAFEDGLLGRIAFRPCIVIVGE